MDEDEDDDPRPDPFSTLYNDPLAGLRERWLSRLNWWQRVLLFVGVCVVAVSIALLATIRIIP
jgi:hypothetical protein